MTGAIVAVAGDFHINSTTALCPPYFDLDDGGSYRASKQQRWIYKQFCAYWDSVKAAKAIHGYPVVAILNGELADDLNHRSTQLITKNPDDMLRLSVATLAPMLAVADHIICLRGTEAHAGVSSHIDEAIARDIGAIPDEDDHHARWLFRGEIAGVTFHICHHPAMGHARAWTRGGDANRKAAQVIFEYVEMGVQPPDLAVFGHTHKPVDSGDNFSTRVIVLPSWQLSNAFGHKLGGGWLPIGAAYFVCKDGEYEGHKRFTRWPIKSWKATKLDLVTTN